MTRKWFQLHLSTAATLVVIAGGLLGLSFVGHEHEYEGPPTSVTRFFYRETQYGFPFTAYTDQITWRETMEHVSPKTFSSIWSYRGLLMNVLANVAFLAVIAVIVESQIRRQKARKP